VRDAGAQWLLVIIGALDIGLVAAVIRTLQLHPAPAFSRRSLRTEARRMFAPDGRRDRWRRRIAEVHRERPLVELLPYLLLFACLYLPTPLRLLGVDTQRINFGPFAKVHESESFLKTLWQVVAAAIGLTVAMVAFAFETYVGSEQRQYGGSLRVYATETHVLTIVRLGVAALLMNGVVLLGIGDDAPAGWAAMLVAAIAGLSLIGVLYVIENAIRSLAPSQLRRSRRRQLDRVVSIALRAQLLDQAADFILREDNGLPVERRFMPVTGARVAAGRTGELHDIRTGTLARIAARHPQLTQDLRIFTLVGLDQEVSEGTELAVVPGEFSARLQSRVRRAFRVRKPASDSEEGDLTAQIDRLHGVAKAAIRAHQAEEWRQIGGLYESILLALPQEAARVGLPFRGAVAAPGIFGLGPLQRIRRNLYEELEVAVEVEDAELVDAISYLPQAIARRADQLGATEIVAAMLGLYPSMYLLAQR
jgi:hypothetical protein